MILLGISGIDKDSTVTLTRGQEILYAVSEERLSRVKQQNGFPYRALEEGLQETGLRTEDIDAVCHCFLEGREEVGLMRSALARNARHVLRANGYPLHRRLVHVLNGQRIVRSVPLARYDAMLVEALRSYGLLDRLHRYHHQFCHAASTFYTSGFDRALILTLDGYGSGQAGGFFMGEQGRITQLAPIDYPHAMGGFYGSITKRLGFILDRHEGKVLGLAAYGDRSKLYDEVLRRFDTTADDSFHFIDANNVFFDMAAVRRHSREDVAAAYQAVLEHVVCLYVKRYVEKTGLDRIALAGGVAANVKLNQRIMELDGVREVYVHPAMSDVGGALGASLMHLAKAGGGLEPRAMEHVYLSRDFSEEEQRQAIREGGLPHVHLPEGAETRTAELIHGSNVVGRWNGRMEYGPRALGNRSILYHAGEREVNRWLNQKLKRTEFMPFAPAALAEDAGLYFRDVDRARHAAEFMTITFDCTDRMKEDCPAAVHVDGTARPQLVRADVNASFHRILTEYKRLSGKSAIVNTSFNMHEEPIVYSPRDAVRGFLDSKIDYLAMGDFICWQPNRPEKAVAG
jgi:carbamoyltransferase